SWGHAVAPSSPVQDFHLHVKAWQHHFAAIFGLDALRRVRGFSPPEMALPNHLDVASEVVKTLKECGYWWLLVQEHSVEQVEDGNVMRNDFPGKFFEVGREASGSDTRGMNVSEYLEYLAGLGVTEADLPSIQPIHQRRIWERFHPGDGPERLLRVIEELKRED